MKINIVCARSTYLLNVFLVADILWFHFIMFTSVLVVLRITELILIGHHNNTFKHLFKDQRGQINKRNRQPWTVYISFRSFVFGP